MCRCTRSQEYFKELTIAVLKILLSSLQVPHLLELKKSPGVQFAGIDEPDDVLNLTHQELFTQGGFIMFDRSALDALSLCMCTFN